MAIVGRYHFHHDYSKDIFEQIGSVVKLWVEEKKLKLTVIECVTDEFSYATVSDDLKYGQLKTTIYYGKNESEDKIEVYMEFDFKQLTASFQSSNYELLRPKIVKDILEFGEDWTYENDTIYPYFIAVEDNAEKLISLILDPNRKLPILVISTSNIAKQLADKLIYDVTGLANVFIISDWVAWEMTKAKALGKELSCYGGYVRLYWPMIEGDSRPNRHPLVNVNRMIDWQEGPLNGVSSIMKRLLFSASINAIKPPEKLINYIKSLRDSSFAEEIKKFQNLVETLRKRNNSLEDEKFVYEELLKLPAQLEIERQKDKEKMDELIAENNNFRENQKHYFDYNNKGSESIKEVIEKQEGLKQEKHTISRVVLDSFRDLSDYIEMLPRASIALGDADQMAGPPSKVRNYLEKLAMLTKQINEGELKKGQIEWLKDNNVDASRESETKNSNKNSIGKRTWIGFDGEDVIMDQHLKTNHATHPDRCIRIYFSYNKKRKKISVGHIGRHLD